MSLSNKVILVSGANRGIGAATVRELLKANVAKVYAGARNVNSLPDFGDARVVPLQLDVTSDTSVNAAANIATDVDVLVNNAGPWDLGDVISSTQEMIEADMQTNYYGTLRVIRAFTPRFVSRGSGTIANVVSIVGLAAVPLLAGYSASKAALQSLDASPTRHFGKVRHHRASASIPALSTRTSPSRSRLRKSRLNTPP